MKLLYAVLFIGLSVTTYAQSLPQTSNQSNTPSATSQPQQSSAQTQGHQQPSGQSTTTQRVRQSAHFHRWEVGGGYSHITGNGGLNGFNVGGSVFLAPKISLGFNYDGVYDNSVLGTFAVTNVGLTVAKNHLQNFLTGPRIYFPGVHLTSTCNINVVKNFQPRLNPFVEAQFGESNLYSQVVTTNVGTVSSAETAFTWVLGGGADIGFSENWAARFNADLVRTHFVYEGQSRLRIILGVVYKF